MVLNETLLQAALLKTAHCEPQTTHQALSLRGADCMGGCLAPLLPRALYCRSVASAPVSSAQLSHKPRWLCGQPLIVIGSVVLCLHSFKCLHLEGDFVQRKTIENCYRPHGLHNFVGLLKEESPLATFKGGQSCLGIEDRL